MTCLEFTDTVLQRLVAAGFEVIPAPGGYRWQFGAVVGAPHTEEMGAWLDAVTCTLRGAALTEGAA
jgi:hypothetical protein